MDKNLLYKRAYRILGEYTPLKSDCGLLCNKACCGGACEQGMLLFPGEEQLYERLKSENFKLKPSNIKLDDENQIYHLACNSNCSRSSRPLGCRIFPTQPYIDSAGRLSLRMDLRGYGICPLVKHTTVDSLNRIFLRKLRELFYLLKQDKDILKFIILLSGQYDDLAPFLLHSQE